PPTRVWCITKSELADSAFGYLAIFEILTGSCALNAVKLSNEPILGGCHDVMKSCACFLTLGSARVRLRDFHLSFGGQVFHRIHETEPALVGHPANGITMRAATKAMVEPFFVVNCEAGRLFVMKRTTCFELAACLLNLYRPADQRGQSCPAA